MPPLPARARSSLTSRSSLCCVFHNIFDTRLLTIYTFHSPSIGKTVYGSTRPTARGNSARHAGHADFEDVVARPYARLWHRGTHPPDVGRRAGSRGRFALSGAAAAADSGVGFGGVGAVGEQPEGTLLPADQGGP